jgi:hypothetical protein
MHRRGRFGGLARHFSVAAPGNDRVEVRPGVDDRKTIGGPEPRNPDLRVAETDPMSLHVGRRLEAGEAGQSVTDAKTDSTALHRTIEAFARSELQKRGLVDALISSDEITVFSWPEARAAIVNEHRPGVYLDVVLQNMAQAFDGSLSDAAKKYAFARMPLAIPGEKEPWPLTVALKREGDRWVPVRLSDNVIPF